MPLLNKIFYKSYCNIANNKKTIAVCEWYPPNLKLLKHPSLVATPNPPVGINFEDGLAVSVLYKILHERSQSEGAKMSAENRKSTNDSIVENIQMSQYLTSELTQNTVHSLNELRFLIPFCQCMQWNADKVEEKKTKRKEAATKLARTIKITKIWS